MTLQASGPISLADIQTEFGGSNPISMSEYYRGGAYVGSGAPNVPTSGAISLSQFYGAAAAFTFNQTISANTANYRLHDALVAAGWNGTTPINATITINSGVYVYESGLGNWAMIIGKNNNTTFPAGSSVTLINNGTIIGTGGTGGYGGDPTQPGYVALAGATGGNGLLLYSPVTIYNYGAIYGGGGGGGGGGGSYYYWSQDEQYYGGGGGGGGAGFNPGTGGCPSYGQWRNGAYCHVAYGKGNTGGTLTGGTGGLYDYAWGNYGSSKWASGGNGGNAGLAGGAGKTIAGLHITVRNWAQAGGAPGYYIYNNGYATWAATGTRVGQIL